MTTNERPLTRDDAERINVYQHLAWYSDLPARVGLHASQDPADHLEQLTRVAELVNRLDSWQALGVHRAVLAGASVHELVVALGEPAEQVMARWRGWSQRQRNLWQHWTAEDPQGAQALGFDPDQHDRVEATLVEQLATETNSVASQHWALRWQRRCCHE
jgi:hypothetical protein